jgi:hypothetical protein
MPKTDPKTILNLGTDPGLNIYAASTQSIAQLAGNTNVFITNINQSVVEYINTTSEAGAAGNTTEVQFNVNDTVMGDAGLTYNFQTDSLTVAGNVAAGNIRTDHLLYANGVAWNFPGSVTTLPGANVTGQVGNALIAGTVYTNAQPNITSVGTLGNLTVSGNTNLNNVIISGSLISSGASPAPVLSGFILSTVSANLGSPSHVTITGGMAGQVLMTDGSGHLSWTDMFTPGNPSLHSLTDVNVSGMTDGQVLTWSSSNTRWENKNPTGGGGSSFDSSAQLHLTNTSFSSLTTNGALVVDGGVGIAGNINAGGRKHTLNGNLHITGVDSSSIYIGAYADVQPMTAPVIVAKDSYDTYVQAALINSSQFGSADWVAYSDQGDETQGWADFGMTGSNFSDINYTITGKNDGYFFVQGLTGQGGNMVLATGAEGGSVHRDIVFATGGFYAENERMRLNHEDTTLYVGGHAEGGTNVTNLDVNGDIISRGHTYLGPIANVSITGGTVGKVLSTDGFGNLSWASAQSGPTGARGQGFTFRGAYTSGAIYTPYDVVTYQGSAYTCIATAVIGSHSNPSVDTGKFSLIVTKGDTGDQGPQGDTGAQGVSVTLQGTLALIADLDNVVNPQQGDAWIVTESNGGDLYFYTAGSTWDNIGKIVGPEGPRGAQGLKGDTGAQGEPGTPADTGNFTFNGDTLTSPTNGIIQIPNNDNGGINSLNNRGRLWFDTNNSFNIVADDTYQFSFMANGHVSFGGGYTFPNVKGTNGQILVTDSAGTLTWHNQAALTNIFDQTLNTTDTPTFGGLSIEATGDTWQNWLFDADGNISTTDGFSKIIHTPDGGVGLWSSGATAQPSLNYADFSNVVVSSDITLTTDSGSKTWTFGADGILTLPVGGDILDSNGISVLGGGSGDTGNITFSGDTIGSTNDSVNITGSNYTQIECTDNGSYTTQIWTEQSGAYVYVDGTQWAFTTPTVAGSVSNAFRMPNDVEQRSGDYVNCDPNMDTVIYTSSNERHHTLKLLLNIEGVEDGQSQPDTQSCEMIVAKSFRNNTVAGSAYGLVYTSTNPLATLSTRWNASISRIEVVCRPTSSMNGVWVHTSGTELWSSAD